MACGRRGVAWLMWLPVALLAWGPAGGRVAAELKPDEIAVVCIADSPQSVELAEYYCQARGVPQGQICRLPIKPQVTLARQEWDQVVRPFIREWLTRERLADQVRCLVTVWDVPLRIGRSPAVPADHLEDLQSQRGLRQGQVQSLIGELERMSRELAGQDGQAAETPERRETPSTAELRDRFQAALQQLQAAAQQKELELQERAKLEARVLQVMQRAGGLQAVVQVLSRQRPTDPQQRSQMVLQAQAGQGQLGGLALGLQSLEHLPESPQRDAQLLRLLDTSAGWLGSLGWLDSQLEVYRKNESQASFDSELSLLHWRPYALIRWLPNRMGHRWTPEAGDPRTLMVARIEAPTWALSKQLIDTALRVEKEGLQGKVYIDSRGIQPQPGRPAPGSYADYDESLRQTATLFRERTSLQLVSDDRPALFQPGDCPEAALYCGWYSLSKYIDAFDWQPGSVAYHIASGEAVTLRDAGSQAWCKRMLEDGVCATLGPVSEPYLAAFPRPDEFFTVLLSGEFNLVETYYRTKPFNSWQMVLVGDPLYNPFRVKSPLEKEGLSEAQKKLLAR